MKKMDFVAKEYEMLHSFRSDLLQIMEARLNVFMVLIGGYVALIAAFLQSYEKMKDDFTYTIPIIAGAVSVTIILIGIVTFGRMIKRSCEIVIATCTINKIQEQMLADDQDLKNYIPQPKTMSKTPSFLSNGPLVEEEDRFFSLPNIVALLNSLIIQISVLAMFRAYIGQPCSKLLFTLPIFVVSYYFHDKVYKRALSQMVVEAKSLYADKAS